MLRHTIVHIWGPTKVKLALKHLDLLFISNHTRALYELKGFMNSAFRNGHPKLFKLIHKLDFTFGYPRVNFDLKNPLFYQISTSFSEICHQAHLNLEMFKKRLGRLYPNLIKTNICTNKTASKMSCFHIYIYIKSYLLSVNNIFFLLYINSNGRSNHKPTKTKNLNRLN